MKERIGVYICHCGGNISDYVDVEQARKILHDELGVKVIKDVMFACADSNQKEMVKDIKDNSLDAIVVASCSPKLHLHTFRNVALRAGLNQYNYVQVNIREQCSWPHSDQPNEATLKAVGLIRAGIKRVINSEALENIEITAQKSVLVVGAGVAGMRAAIDLAKTGNEVFLIEKDFFVGGKVAESSKLFMTGEDGKDVIARLHNEIKKHSNITLFTGAEIEKTSGNVGNFIVNIKMKPRYIVKNYDKTLMKQAIEECPVEVADEFYLGLKKRKAIYKKYAEALPDLPVVDKDALVNEKSFLEKYSKCIDLNQQEVIVPINVGAVLVSSGFDFYKPKEDEFGYHTNQNVITLPDFKKLMELNNDKLVYNNKPINNIAFIYCVGSRQGKGENKYCSRFCCTSAVHTSINLHEKYKDIKTYHLHLDVRTYGKQEILYEKSSKLGDIYIKFDEKKPPIVETLGNKTIVKVKDILSSDNELAIEAELVVLVTGMTARSDSSEISEKFKIPIGNDKFFNEIHPKLKPVETVIKGVYIGGACQGPKNISESVQSSLSAAAKINTLIHSGNIQLEPSIAKVDAETCNWCGKCADVCEYFAVSKTDYNGKEIAAINKATCKGCGICAPICPSNSIEILQYTDIEIESMIDGFMQKVELIASDNNEEETNEEGSALRMKELPEIWKKIYNSVSDKSKTIPELVAELNIKNDIITYNLMTMNKYSIVEADGMDDKEEYYYYRLKKQ